MKQLAPMFCQRALDGAATLPAAERADLYEFAAQVLSREGYGMEAEAAHDLSENLRSTEAHQMRFDGLLSAAVKVN